MKKFSITGLFFGLLILVAPTSSLFDSSQAMAQDCAYVDMQILWCPREEECISCAKEGPGQCYKASHAESMPPGSNYACGACPPPCDVVTYSVPGDNELLWEGLDEQSNGLDFAASEAFLKRIIEEAPHQAIWIMNLANGRSIAPEVLSGQFVTKYMFLPKGRNALGEMLSEHGVNGVLTGLSDIIENKHPGYVVELKSHWNYTEYVGYPTAEGGLNFELSTWRVPNGSIGDTANGTHLVTSEVLLEMGADNERYNIVDVNFLNRSHSPD